MGKHKTANKGGTNLQKGASPFPSSLNGEEGDVVQDPMEEITSMEEVLCTQMFPPKCLLDLGELVNHHQRGWYPLSIDKITHLPPRIEGAIIFG